MSVEVKIGVTHSPREIALDSDQSPEEVESAVSAALTSGGPLRLVDAKGSVVLVPAGSVAYVEIGAPRKGGVGFGML